MSDEQPDLLDEPSGPSLVAGSVPDPSVAHEASGAVWVWRAAMALVFVIIAFQAYRIPAMQKADPDMFWHVATGRWIVEHRGIPTTDIFSWYGIEHGSAWLVQEWLSEVVQWGVYGLGGFQLLYVFTALLAATATTLTYVLSRVRSVRPFAAVLVALTAGVGLMRFVSPRPQMFTFCLIVLLCVCLEREWFWAAPPIVLLGANLHGGTWPLYLVIIAFYVLPKRWSVLAASAVAVLVNPAGIALVTLPFRTVLHPGATAVIEFQRTALASNPIDMAAYLGVVVLLVVSGKRPRLRDGLLALAVTALSLTALRHVAFFYLLVLPLLAPYITGRERGGATSGTSERRQQRVLLAALGATAVAVAFITLTAPPFSIDKGYPKAALAYVRDHRIERVMNIWNDGGYMIFNAVPPFVDGRGDPFVPTSTGGTDLISEYLDAILGKSDWAPLVRRERVEWFLVSKSMAFYRVLQHSAYASPAYEDSEFVLFHVDVP